MAKDMYIDTDITAKLTRDVLEDTGTVVKNNWVAEAAPTVNDDVDSGYEVGSMWIYNKTVYICVDATADAADWDTITTS